MALEQNPTGAEPETAYGERVAKLMGIATTMAVAAAVGLAGSATARPDAPVTLRIERLTGSVIRLGSWASEPLYGVRLKATVCMGSAAQALRYYPSETRITHFAVSKTRTRWWPARTVVDRAPWEVSIGETWHGKACGVVTFVDPIPPVHYGVESLGNVNGCYGASLTIVIGRAQATHRTLVTCGRRFG